MNKIDIMAQSILDKALKQHLASFDKVISDAFFEHFGIRLKDVKDTENITIDTFPMEHLETYRYRNEVFLRHDTMPIFSFEVKGDVAEVVVTSKYEKV